MRVSRAQRSTKWCAADPGPLRTPSLGRSRISSAPLRAAPHPGNTVCFSRIYRGFPVLHRIRLYVSNAPIFVSLAGFSAGPANIQVLLKSQGLARVREGTAAEPLAKPQSSLEHAKRAQN